MCWRACDSLILDSVIGTNYSARLPLQCCLLSGLNQIDSLSLRNGPTLIIFNFHTHCAFSDEFSISCHTVFLGHWEDYADLYSTVTSDYQQHAAPQGHSTGSGVALRRCMMPFDSCGQCLHLFRRLLPARAPRRASRFTSRHAETFCASLF